MPEELENKGEVLSDSNICKVFQGNEVELDIKKGDCDVRADVVIGSKRCVRVWGQVIDCECNPVREALVKLVRCFVHHGRPEYEGVAHTVTDCCGFYQFDIEEEDAKDKYKIIVSKVTCGKDRTIHGDGICFPCIE
jgi:hypothetical protein